MRKRLLAILMAALMVAAIGWSRWLTPLMGNIIVDAVVKTIVLGSVAVVAVYAWRISPTVNDLIDRTIQRIKK